MICVAMRAQHSVCSPGMSRKLAASATATRRSTGKLSTNRAYLQTVGNCELRLAQCHPLTTHHAGTLSESRLERSGSVSGGMSAAPSPCSYAQYSSTSRSVSTCARGRKLYVMRANGCGSPCPEHAHRNVIQRQLAAARVQRFIEKCRRAGDVSRNAHANTVARNHVQVLCFRPRGRGAGGHVRMHAHGICRSDCCAWIDELGLVHESLAFCAFESRAEAQAALDAAGVAVVWPPCQDCVPMDVQDAVKFQSYLAQQLELADSLLCAWLVGGWLFVRPAFADAWLDAEVELDAACRAGVKEDVDLCAAHNH